MGAWVSISLSCWQSPGNSSHWYSTGIIPQHDWLCQVRASLLFLSSCVFVLEGKRKCWNVNSFGSSPVLEQGLVRSDKIVCGFLHLSCNEELFSRLFFFFFFGHTKPDTDSQFGRGLEVYLGAQQLCCSPGWLWHSSCHLPALCWAVGNHWTFGAMDLGQVSFIMAIPTLGSVLWVGEKELEMMVSSGSCGRQRRRHFFDGVAHMSRGMGNLPAALLQILWCLANKREQFALPATCYLPQLETATCKIHFRGRSSHPRD